MNINHRGQYNELLRTAKFFVQTLLSITSTAHLGSLFNTYFEILTTKLNDPDLHPRNECAEQFEQLICSSLADCLSSYQPTKTDSQIEPLWNATSAKDSST